MSMSYGMYGVWGDTSQQKIDYTFPEGDDGIIADRQTYKYNSTQTTYGPGSTIEIAIPSNGPALDPGRCYLTGIIKVKAVRNADAYDLTQATTTVARTAALVGSATSGCGSGTAADLSKIRPVLHGGIGDLFNSIRTKAFNGIDVEFVEKYNVINHLRQWQHRPADDSMGYNKLDLTGDCLTEAEYANLQPWSTVNSAKASAVAGTTDYSGCYGIRFIVKLTHSGFWSQSRFIPLRYLNQLMLQIQLEAAGRAFQITCPELGVNSVGSTGLMSSANPTAGLVTYTLDYQLSQVQLAAEMVVFTPALEMAIKKTVEDKQGLPITFDTWAVQQDVIPGATSTYQVKMGKGVANAKNVFTIMSCASFATDNLRNSFESEPFGLKQYRYQLGTKFFPDQPVTNPLEWVVEADKALGYKQFNSLMPASDITDQIGVSRSDLNTKALQQSAFQIQGLGGYASNVNGPDVGQSDGHSLGPISIVASKDVYGGRSGLPEDCQWYAHLPRYWPTPFSGNLSRNMQYKIANYVAPPEGSQACTPPQIALGTAFVAASSAGAVTTAIGDVVPTSIASGNGSMPTSTLTPNVIRLADATSVKGALQIPGPWLCPYPPQCALRPTKFRLGASLQSTQLAEVSGVSTNHGNQLWCQLDFWPSVHGVKKDFNALSWGVDSARNCFTCLQYTRVIIIKPSFNVQIRE
jgi:hypothetical protein